jgi:hypothetical protein
MNPLVLPFAEFHRRLSEVFGEAPLGRYDGAYGDQFKYPEVYSAAARKRLEEFLDGKNNFTTVLYSIPYLDRWTLVRRLQYGENGEIQKIGGRQTEIASSGLNCHIL